MGYHYDDYDPYDSFEYERACEYGDYLAEMNLQQCYCGEKYDIDAEECPKCVKLAEIQDKIASGELDPDVMCFACHEGESTTTFMGQSVCWPCYEALANGRHTPDNCTFADPGGNSALRAAGPGNPRVHPCPNCYEPNQLTPQDVARGYQCDSCADMTERGW